MTNTIRTWKRFRYKLDLQNSSWNIHKCTYLHTQIYIIYIRTVRKSCNSLVNIWTRPTDRKPNDKSSGMCYLKIIDAPSIVTMTTNLHLLKYILLALSRAMSLGIVIVMLTNCQVYRPHAPWNVTRVAVRAGVKTCENQ